MKNLDYLTLILAGGRGERLSVLTKEIPKPAIPFGGAYRLIDFTLSNCKHSGASVIGILTQYRQKELAEYISTGNEWFSADKTTEIVTLPPKLKYTFYDYYTGTADAVMKNSEFVNDHNPENVLVLSGDHVYKMDYSNMLKTHMNSGAAVTIAAVEVPWNEAPRFGIINAGNDDRIVGFEEKPKNPQTNLASMGVYIFNWNTLKNHLYISTTNPDSKMDIGKNIIPQMLMCGEKLVVHRFGGYWRDVGDIYSLWEANMDLLSDLPAINLHDEKWKIIGRHNGTPRYHNNSISDNGYIKNSIVTEGCVNRGKVTDSVISADVEIGMDANIYNSVIMPGAKIGKGTSIVRSIIGSNAVIGDYSAISGLKPDGECLDCCQGINVIGNHTHITRHGGEKETFAVFPQPETCAV